MIERIVKRMTELNAEICNDEKNLGEGFAIGHSFFCPDKPHPDWEAWYADVIHHEVAPLLREYWFDAPDKADEATQRLLAP